MSLQQMSTIVFIVAYDLWWRGRLSFLFAWYDGWVGVYWDRKKSWLYILPIPMCGIILKFKLEQGNADDNQAG